MSLVRVEREGAVAVIWLDNPPLNLMSAALTSDLDRAILELAEDQRVRVVVVTGAGRAFCAGSDIREFPPLMEQGTVVSDKLSYENAVFDRLADLRQPTIAALNGIALGGGAELSLCCDYRIMADNGQIGFPEIRLGTIPGSGGLTRLPRLIGVAQALALVLDGTTLMADQAARIGLVSEVTPRDAVLTSAVERARRWAAQPARAVQNIKRGIAHGADGPLAEATQRTLELSAVVWRSVDMQEGVRAFLEKRTPNFRHE